MAETKKIKVGVNGFGRMGKLWTRIGFESDVYDIVHVNEILGSVDTHALLLEFDTVHGKWNHPVKSDGENFIIGDKKISFSDYKDPKDIPWEQYGVDVVLECTGKFKTRESIEESHLQKAGVKKVIVSAPIKTGEVLNIVCGVNESLYEHENPKQNIITAASCTTNCIAPVVKVMLNELGIKHATMTTIHDITNTQTVVDKGHSDPRRARSCINSLIPTSTGSATAITHIYPELKGKINGVAVRVPLLNASLVDIVFEVPRATTKEEVNSLMKKYAEGALEGILGFEDRPLVSADYTNEARSAVVDGQSTMVIDNTQVKLLVWYDNEWGYCNRMHDITEMVAKEMLKE